MGNDVERSRHELWQYKQKMGEERRRHNARACHSLPAHSSSPVPERRQSPSGSGPGPGPGQTARLSLQVAQYDPSTLEEPSCSQSLSSAPHWVAPTSRESGTQQPGNAHELPWAANGEPTGHLVAVAAAAATMSRETSQFQCVCGCDAEHNGHLPVAQSVVEDPAPGDAHSPLATADADAADTDRIGGRRNKGIEERVEPIDSKVANGVDGGEEVRYRAKATGGSHPNPNPHPHPERASRFAAALCAQRERIEAALGAQVRHLPGKLDHASLVAFALSPPLAPS